MVYYNPEFTYLMNREIDEFGSDETTAKCRAYHSLFVRGFDVLLLDIMASESLKSWMELASRVHPQVIDGAEYTWQYSYDYMKNVKSLTLGGTLQDKPFPFFVLTNLGRDAAIHLNEYEDWFRGKISHAYSAEALQPVNRPRESTFDPILSLQETHVLALSYLDGNGGIYCNYLDLGSLPKNSRLKASAEFVDNFVSHYLNS